MLSRRRAAVAAVASLAIVGVFCAPAAGALSCLKIDPHTRRCILRPVAPGKPKQPGRGGTGGGGSHDPYITVNGVRCLPGGLILPQPPKSDPIWGGHTDGAIYLCWVGHAGSQFSLRVWLGTAPTAPDPAVLARQAMAMMTMRAIGIGIVPEDKPGKIGIIGFPVWLWTTNPGAQTWGPQTRTATAGPYSVTATAQVDHVLWDMGDGHTVTCHSKGTPYEGRYGKSASPDCGYLYQRPSGMKGYTVTATSYWQVAWSGMGQSGVIPLQLSSSTRIIEGEVQVLVQ